MKCKTTVSRPELTEEERAQRMSVIKQAAVKLVRAADLQKRKETQKHDKERN